MRHNLETDDQGGHGFNSISLIKVHPKINAVRLDKLGCLVMLRSLRTVRATSVRSGWIVKSSKAKASSRSFATVMAARLLRKSAHGGIYRSICPCDRHLYLLFVPHHAFESTAIMQISSQVFRWMLRPLNDQLLEFCSPLEDLYKQGIHGICAGVCTLSWLCIHSDFLNRAILSPWSQSICQFDIDTAH
jgi:hypothetical protein